MAYVKMSKSVIDSIIGEMNKVYQKELNEHKIPDLTAHNDTAAAYVLDKIWGEYLPLRPQMPSKWCNSVDHRYGICVVSSAEESPSVRYHVTAGSASKMLLPPGTDSRWNTFRIDGSDDEVYGPLVAPTVREFRNVVIKRSEVTVAWQARTAAVADLLSKCTSLNKALEAMPALALYVPDDLKRKLEAKTAKRGKAQEEDISSALATIDVDALVTAAVSARMGGA